MAAELYMPQTGVNIKEGVITRWLVSVGDPVKAGDRVLEVETDKATVEVEAPADGVLLRKYYNDGDTVPVVTVVGYVGRPDEQVPESADPWAEEEGRARDPADYDVIVIGGGPAGYTAAVRAARLGGRVALFEKKSLGGTALHGGCAPLEVYARAAGLVRDMALGESLGIRLEGRPEVDLKRLRAHCAERAKKKRGEIEAQLESRGIERITGRARLTAERHVECRGKVYTAHSVVLCGGGKPGRPEIPGADSPRVLDTDGVWDLDELPGKLAVVGGGEHACSLAAALSALGSWVTLVTDEERLVPDMDRDLSGPVRTGLESVGIRVLTARRVEHIEDVDEGAALHLDGGETVQADLVLLCTARRADLGSLGELDGEIDMAKGRVAVDDRCLTNLPDIYACGDITGAGRGFSTACHMGDVAAKNAMGGSATARISPMPVCLLAGVEAAGVGLTEELAGDGILVGRSPLEGGFVKAVVDGTFGEILGVHIVGQRAAELAASAKMLMDMEITAYEAGEMVLPHPALSEALSAAMRDALGTEG